MAVSYVPFMIYPFMDDLPMKNCDFPLFSMIFQFAKWFNGQTVLGPVPPSSGPRPTVQACHLAPNDLSSPQGLRGRW